MKKFLFILTSIFIYIALFADDVDQEKLAQELIKNRMFIEMPFDLLGEWQLLMPKKASVLQKKESEVVYSDDFIIFDIFFDKDGKVLMKLASEFNWETYSWEHAWMGTKFYIYYTGTDFIHRFYYFDSLPYREDEYSDNLWFNIQRAWEITQTESQIALLGYQLMENEDEILDKQIKEQIEELKKIRKPSSSKTISLLMYNIVAIKDKKSNELIELKEEGGVQVILTRSKVLK